jgi:apolipoprotein D and lipocalin family protein
MAFALHRLRNLALPRARALVGVLLLALAASACTGIPKGVAPVDGFDGQRYAGKWFEIMRLDHSFERGLTNVTATYTLRDDGSVGVVNRGFDAKNCRWKEATGRAVFQGAPDVASLSVTFFWPFAGGYHVLALDKPDYGWALVSGPTRDYLWLLARRPDLSPDIRNRLVEQARGLGFPTDELILVEHGALPCVPAP